VKYNHYLSRKDSGSFLSILVIAELIFIISAIILLNRYFHFEIDPDGLSYVSIAQKYLKGNFSEAINGYWGPLFSWLLIPFLKFKINPLWAIKYLNIFLGCLSIFGFFLLTDRFDLPETYRKIYPFFLIPTNLYFSLYFSTPDLLILVIAQFYLYLIYRHFYYRKISILILLGFLGSVGFLAKSYFLIFFLFHFLLLNLLNWIRIRSRVDKNLLVKRILISLSVFMVLSGIWVFLISRKYHQLTFSTAGNYNYRLVGPTIPDFPLYYLGFQPPADNSALSVWEDPPISTLPAWSPFSSPANFAHQVQIIKNNSAEIIKILNSWSVYSLALVTVLFFILLKRLPHISGNEILFYSFITIILWLGGYALITVEERYLWPAEILLFLSGLKLFSEYFSNEKKWYFKWVPIIIFLLSFIKSPFQLLNKPITVRPDAFQISQTLASQGISGNIAANDRWDLSLFIAYYLNSRYYGTQGQISNDQVYNELKKNNINYYLYWVDKSHPVSFNQGKLINIDKLPDLLIYRID
jgi:hypothetical protein